MDFKEVARELADEALKKINKGMPYKQALDTVYGNFEQEENLSTEASEMLANMVWSIVEPKLPKKTLDCRVDGSIEKLKTQKKKCNKCSLKSGCLTKATVDAAINIKEKTL